MKNLEVDPHMCMFLAYHKGGIVVQWEKDKIVSD